LLIDYKRKRLKNYKSDAVVLVGDSCSTVISVPRRVEACVAATKRTLHKRYPKWSDKRINDRAWAICQDLENRGKLKDSADMKPKMFFVESKIIKRMGSMTEAMEWLGDNATLTPFAESLLAAEKGEAGNTNFPLSITGSYTTTSLDLDGAGSNHAISESTTEDPAVSTHILIAGTAISTGTTRNLHTFLSKELEKACPTLAGKPIQLDHSHKSEDNIGKVLASAYDRDPEIIKYIGRIREAHAVTPAVSSGDIDTVSVGGFARDMICNICGESKVPDSAGRIACNHRLGRIYEGQRATAIGIDINFVELSVTPIPADPRASAGVMTHDSMQSALVALAESYIGADSSVSEEPDQSVQLVEKDTLIEKLQVELKASHTRERKRLAEGIAEAEVKMGVTAPKEKSNRVTSLSEKSIETLEEVKSTVDRQLEMFLRKQDDEPTSRGKTIEESPGVADELTWGETKAVVREMLFNFGPPSASAKRSTSGMIGDPQFEQHRRYKEIFAKQEGGRIE